jgi:hypothetical protein
MKLKIFLFFIFSSLVFYGQSAWKLRKNLNGISVYTRKPANSDFAEFRASTVVDANVEKILKIILNSSMDSQWVDRVKYSKIISKNKNTHISYEQTELPIGFKNRDIVLQNTLIRKKNGSVLIKMEAVPDKYPHQDKFVRIRNAYGYWLLQPKDANRTYVTYQFFSDPQAGFPSWIVNLFIVDGPINTLSNLKKIVKK